MTPEKVDQEKNTNRQETVDKLISKRTSNVMKILSYICTRPIAHFGDYYLVDLGFEKQCLHLDLNDHDGIFD